MDDLSAIFESAMKWIRANLTMVLAVLWLVYKMYKRSQPFPTFEGSIVKTIKDEETFNKLIKDTKSVVICDFYAKWCGPCRSCAPSYEDMSKKYSESTVTFAKVDVDVARDVAQSQQIRSMPTFKIYKDGKCVETLTGFSRSNIESKLETYGAKTNTTSKKDD
eukprot:g3408.t1